MFGISGEDDRDNPVVSLAIGLLALGLLAVGCMALGRAKDAKAAVRGAQGPSLPSQEDAPDVCVGPDCAIPTPGK